MGRAFGGAALAEAQRCQYIAVCRPVWWVGGLLKDVVGNVCWDRYFKGRLECQAEELNLCLQATRNHYWSNNLKSSGSQVPTVGH